MTNFSDIMSELDWAEETEQRQQELAPQVRYFVNLALPRPPPKKKKIHRHPQPWREANIGRCHSVEKNVKKARKKIMRL
jgi:hypothetical protein